MSFCGSTGKYLLHLLGLRIPNDACLMFSRRQEVLWNSSLPSYSQQSVRQEAIQAMADKFAMTMEQVKRKIHTTRSTYNQMRVKVLQAEATGRVYQPMLSWYSQASFLDSVITLRKNRDSLPIHSTSRTSATDLEEFAKDMDMGDQDSQPRPKRIRNSGSTTTSIRVKVKADTGELLMEDDTGVDEYHDHNHHHNQQMQNVEYTNLEEEEEGEEEYEEQDAGIEIVQVNRDYTVQQHKKHSTTQPAASSAASHPPPLAPAIEVEAPAPPMAKDEIALFCDLMDNQLRALSTATAIETMCKVQSLITQARLEALMRKKGQD